MKYSETPDRSNFCSELYLYPVSWRLYALQLEPCRDALVWISQGWVVGNSPILLLNAFRVNWNHKKHLPRFRGPLWTLGYQSKSNTSSKMINGAHGELPVLQIKPPLITIFYIQEYNPVSENWLSNKYCRFISRINIKLQSRL